MGKHDVCSVAPKARHDAAQLRATGKSPFLSDFLSSPSPMRVFPRFYPCGSTSNSLPTICRCKRLIAPSNHLYSPDILLDSGSLRLLAPFALSGNRPPAQAGALPACDNRRSRAHSAVTARRATGSPPRHSAHTVWSCRMTPPACALRLCRLFRPGRLAWTARCRAPSPRQGLPRRVCRTRWR